MYEVVTFWAGDDF